MDKTLIESPKFIKAEKVFRGPMIALTLSYLILFTIRISYQLPQLYIQIIDMADLAIWLGFVIEYGTLLILATHPWNFVKSHLLDLLIILVPLLRVLRLFSIIEIILGSELRLAAASEFYAKLIKADTKITSLILFVIRALSNVKVILIKGKLRHIVALIVFITIFLGALEVYFESASPNANIKNLNDGIWWSIVSITTVGYGDKYPVTLPGRIIGVALLTIGVALFTLLTAEMSSLLVGKHEDRDKKEIMTKLENLDAKLDALKQQIS